MDRRNVVLTGFMGTGKTTVGRLLAERLDYEFVDSDAVIEAQHGSIPAIFAEHGEGRFRQFERDVAGELALRDGLVIATGGRLMLDAVNAEALASTGDVICLTADLDTIIERVTNDGGADRRPMLAGDDVHTLLAGLLAERAAGYARFTAVATDGREPTDVAAKIVELVRA